MASQKLPEDTRVRVEFTEADLDDIAPPPTGETREELLVSLRESVSEAKAGRGGVDARQFLKELAEKHNLPLQPGEQNLTQANA